MCLECSAAGKDLSLEESIAEGDAHACDRYYWPGAGRKPPMFNIKLNHSDVELAAPLKVHPTTTTATILGPPAGCQLP